MGTEQIYDLQLLHRLETIPSRSSS
ncbi:hypothetical protein LINGRAHAP2_LOCUS15785 [Linum grandiflorum]